MIIYDYLLLQNDYLWLFMIIDDYYDYFYYNILM